MQRYNDEAPVHAADATFALLDILVTSAPIGLALVDREFRYLRINDTLAALNGLSVEAHLGRRARDLFPDDAINVWEPMWQQVMATGEPIVGLSLSNIVHGGRRTALVSYYPVRTRDGEIVGIGIVVLDDTERQQTQVAQTLLAAASRLLVAARDEQAVLQAMVQTTVPTFADACVTWLVDEAQQLRHAEVAHVLPEKAALVREVLCRTTTEAGTVSGPAQVLQSGKPTLLPIVPPGLLPILTQDEQSLGLAMQIEPKSYMAVPLKVRGRVIGAVQFLITESERRFSGTDLQLAEELAQRCALVLDNVQLYEDVQQALTHRDEALALLDTVLDTAPVGFALFDTGLRYLRINNRMAEINGVPAAEHLGRTGPDVFPDLRDVVTPLLRQVLETGQPLSDLEVSGTTPAAPGQTRYWTASYYPVHDGAGQIVGVAAMVRDITAQRQVEDDRAALLRSEAAARARAERHAERTSRLQAVAAALAYALTPDDVAAVLNIHGCAALRAEASFVALVDEDGTHGELVHSLGYQPGQVQNWRRFSLDAVLPATDAMRSGEPVVLATIEALLARYPHLASNLWAEYAARAAIPLRVGEETLGVVVLSFREPQNFTAADVAFMQTLGQQGAQALQRAQLYAAEQRARRRQDFLAQAATLLNASLDYETTLQKVARVVVPLLADTCAVDLLDASGTIQRVAAADIDPAREALLFELRRRFPFNPAAAGGVPAVLRTGEAELVSEVAEQPQEAVLDAEQAQLLQTLKLSSAMVVPLIRRGQVFGTMSFGMAGSGRRFGAHELALACELAERASSAIDNARLFRDAQEAIGVRDAFLSIAAHELKTPLTALFGHAQLLQRRLQRQEASERDQHTTSLIVEQGRRLNTMITDLLDLSRIERGQLQIERELLDLGELARRIVAEVEPTLTHHTLVAELPQKPLIVAGDALRLEQVIQNLLSNGVKYSPYGGTVRLVIEQCGAEACIAVSDQGIGIPTEALPSLFQRFFRATNAERQQISGVGVGLYVVKEIVTKHSGSVGVESTEGQGSTFTVRLPLSV